MPEKRHNIAIYSAYGMDDLVTAFHGYDRYNVSLVTDLEGIAPLVAKVEIDAFITVDDLQVVDCISDLSKGMDNQHKRPLLCVITTTPERFTDQHPGAIVLPKIDPRYIEHSLRTQLEYRKRLSDLAREQDEINLLKNAIVRNVSHELKTPLLQVKSAVALIAEDTTDENNRLSKMAVQSTARLEAVIKNITLLADSMNGNFGPILAHESIEQAIRNLRRIWIHRDAISRIETVIEPDLPPIMADKQGLGVVMQQLLDNALKFSNDDIIISVSKHEGQIRFAVTDKGIGIEPQYIQQIFESFYQVDSSSTRRY
ncbi:MAG: HAMP domain-containing sensor histidine kinase, partial [Chloroflexota bacterium]